MTEHVEFVPRKTIYYDAVRLNLAMRLLMDSLARPLRRVVRVTDEWLRNRRAYGWLNRWINP